MSEAVADGRVPQLPLRFARAGQLAQWVLPRALVVLIVWQLAMNAWLSDDYFVGIRQVLNLLAGNEFSFNAGERVQTMTSPLWGLVMIGVVQAGGLFYGPMIFSLCLAMVAVLLIARRAGQPERAPGAILALGGLFLSRSFTDFSSGGLEGPLAFALIAVCVFSAARLDPQAQPSLANFRRNFLVFSLAAGLLFLTRYDYAVLAGPAVLWVAVLAVRQGGWRMLAWGAPALALVVAWLAFSTIYYGSPFSNTAFSKLATGLEGPLKHQHSFQYFLASFRFDAPGFILMLAAAVFAIMSKRISTAAWMAGVCMYMGYVYSFGGDFMAGRFFAAPIVVSACVLALAFPERRQIAGWLSSARLSKPDAARLTLAGVVAAGFAGCVGVAVVLGSPTMRHLSLEQYQYELHELDYSNAHLILDEKQFYLGRRQGLFAAGHQSYQRELEQVQREQWSGPGARVDEWKGVTFVDCGFAGEIAFAAGPDVYVFDGCGLADPFMSKLPMYVPHSGGQQAGYRPGHFTRAEPPGYAASFSTLPKRSERPHSMEALPVARENRLEDPDLAYLYDEVRLIVSGPLFDPARWGAIWDLHTGATLERARSAAFYMQEDQSVVALSD